MTTELVTRPVNCTDRTPSMGWLREVEDRPFLMLTRTPYEADWFEPVNRSFDPRDWLPIRQQGPLRAGCGMALATCLEVVHWLKSGSVVRLSGAFAYLAAQKLSGRLGRDSGATVCGTVKAAKVFGTCRQTIVPETQSYGDSFTPRARRSARRFRILSHSMLGDYRDVFRFLAAGLGAVLLAIPWRRSLAFAGARIDADTGPMLGDHCVAVVGIDVTVRDDAGRPYLIVANSHGRVWGDSGFAIVAPRLFDDWGQRIDGLLVGLSDQDVYQSRIIPHLGMPETTIIRRTAFEAQHAPCSTLPT